MRFEYHDSSSSLLHAQYKIAQHELQHLSLINWEMDAGIIALADDRPVGGIFFTLSRYRTALLINAAWVSPEFRRQGIYTQLHTLVNEAARDHGKTEIYTYIHRDNELMVGTVAEKIGYSPVMTLYKRSVPEVSPELPRETQR